jgi:hypothetical protein
VVLPRGPPGVLPHNRGQRVVVTQRAVLSHPLIARKMLGLPKRCKLAHAFLVWEFSYKRLKLAPISGPTWRISHLCLSDGGAESPHRRRVLRDGSEAGSADGEGLGRRA